jgi:ribonuclease-3
VTRTVLPLLDFDAHPTLEKDYKTRLQELVHHKTHGKQVQYRLLDATGPDHKKVFTMAVVLDDEVLGTGEGNSKQSAGQAAALDALNRMEKKA